ncbi:MAG: deoxyhypusine synthase family protein [Vicinamibacterales bacterium]
MPYRAPGSPKKGKGFLAGKPIRYYRPKGAAAVRTLIDDGFQAFNAARLGEACRIFTDKMLAPAHDTTIALTIAGAMTPAGIGGCVIEMMHRGLVDFIISTGANLYHDLHYALNFTLRRGSPFVDDRVLYKEGVIRIYDVLFPAQVLLDTDRFVREFRNRAASTARSPPRISTTSSAVTCSRPSPAARNTRSWRAPRSAASPSTPRRPATAPSA